MPLAKREGLLKHCPHQVGKLGSDPGAPTGEYCPKRSEGAKTLSTTSAVISVLQHRA